MIKTYVDANFSGSSEKWAASLVTEIQVSMKYFNLRIDVNIYSLVRRFQVTHLKLDLLLKHHRARIKAKCSHSWGRYPWFPWCPQQHKESDFPWMSTGLGTRSQCIWLCMSFHHNPALIIHLKNWIEDRCVRLYNWTRFVHWVLLWKRHSNRELQFVPLQSFSTEFCYRSSFNLQSKVSSSRETTFIDWQIRRLSPCCLVERSFRRLH